MTKYVKTQHPRAKYQWLSLSEIAKYEPEMKRFGVSKVARSSRGFLAAYKRLGPAVRRNEYWVRKRNGFIARFMAIYRKTPTYRAWLALVAWTYRPDRKFE